MLKVIIDGHHRSRGFCYCDPRVTDIVLYTREKPTDEIAALGAYHVVDPGDALFGTTPTDPADYVNVPNPNPGS